MRDPEFRGERLTDGELLIAFNRAKRPNREVQSVTITQTRDGGGVQGEVCLTAEQAKSLLTALKIELQGMA